MMWYANDFHWGWMLVGGFMMLIFWGGLIALAIVILRSFLKGGSGPSGDDESALSAQQSPMQILERRYSLGEIDREEFKAISDDLAG